MAEPFPEAPITWQGRDAKGNLVDVTSEVSTVTAPPTIATGGDAVQVVYSRTTTLTDAQIKALGTGGNGQVELVPAPGADKVLHYLGGFIICDTTTNYYDNVAATATLAVTMASSYAVSARISGTQLSSLLQVMDIYLMPLPPAGYIPELGVLRQGDGELPANIVNRSLVLRGSNTSAAAFTEGHADNSMTVTVLYTVVDL